MIQEKQFKGEWYLPGSKETFSGTLTFNTTNGLKLELIGSYNTGFSGRNHDIILGKTDKGFVTLLQTRYQSGSYSHETSIQTKIYQPTFILAGHAFGNLDDIKFTSVHFTAFNLREWLNCNALEHIENQNRHSFEYNKPGDIVFECYPGCSASIQFGLDGQYPSQSYELRLEQFCKMIFTYDKPKPYREILTDIFRFIGFITLSTYGQSYPMAITFYNEIIFDEFVSKNFPEKVVQPIDCIYQNIFYKASYKRKDPHQHLVQYQDIQNTFPENVANWFLQSSEMGSVIELLLHGFRDQYNFTTETFMNSVRAIESFHRINHNNKVISKEAVKQIKEVINGTNLSAEQKELVNEKMNFAYEPSLKRRLEEMVELYSFAYFDERVPDKAGWIKKVKNSRNHYTHLDKRQKKQEGELKELFDLTENVRLLLFAAVFKLIGIPPVAYCESVRHLIYST